MMIWTWTGEKNARRIRELYFKAILRQEIAYFDKLGAGEVTTRIQTDTRSYRVSIDQGVQTGGTNCELNLFADLIQQGISEKIPMIMSFIGAFFTGYIRASPGQ
jgi:ATP-binding cassette subfamily B (MDR/TAP) protein 1